MTPQIPESAKVLVIGGGPGGAFAATILAREGIDTVLIEREVHPRYHVGESMLPTLREFMRFVDAEEKYINHGFTKKIGAAFQLSAKKRTGFSDFLLAGSEHYTFNVLRSESDEILIRHAAEQGVKVFEGTRVEAIDFEDDPATSRPVSAKWKSSDGTTGSIKFDYVIDASGRNGILSTKYLHSRVINETLKNIASWGYWKGCDVYAKGTARENVPFFEALVDESGWVWFIPLHNGQVSVGLVMDQDLMNARKKQYPNGKVPSTKEFYLAELPQLAPSAWALIGNAELVSDIRMASDFSYSSPSYAGPGYRLVGDAGAFIDPWLSTGVHIAQTSGMSAAVTICASIRGQCSETYAGDWHTEKFKVCYTRFLVCVLGMYQQMRNKAMPILSNVDEDNFDRAFAFINPVIQGIADLKADTPQEVIAKTMAFCGESFDTKYEAKWNNPEVDAAVEHLDGVEKLITSVQKRSVLRPEDLMVLCAFNGDMINGMNWELKRGNLGLVDGDAA